jgi:hypothetical protein
MLFSWCFLHSHFSFTPSIALVETLMSSVPASAKIPGRRQTQSADSGTKFDDVPPGRASGGPIPAEILTRSMNISLDTRTIGQRFGQKSDANSRGPDADVIS